MYVGSHSQVVEHKVVKTLNQRRVNLQFSLEEAPGRLEYLRRNCNVIQETMKSSDDGRTLSVDVITDEATMLRFSKTFAN